MRLFVYPLIVVKQTLFLPPVILFYIIVFVTLELRLDDTVYTRLFTPSWATQRRDSFRIRHYIIGYGNMNVCVCVCVLCMGRFLIMI